MADQVQKYEVAQRGHFVRRDGEFIEMKVGEAVELSEAEARALGARVRPAGGFVVNPASQTQNAKNERPFDVVSATVKEVLKAVEAGTLTAAQALEAERARAEPRTTLITALEEQEQADDGNPAA